MRNDAQKIWVSNDILALILTQHIPKCIQDLCSIQNRTRCDNCNELFYDSDSKLTRNQCLCYSFITLLFLFYLEVLCLDFGKKNTTSNSQIVTLRESIALSGPAMKEVCFRTLSGNHDGAFTSSKWNYLLSVKSFSL